jgi:hypothetical protein
MLKVKRSASIPQSVRGAGRKGESQQEALLRQMIFFFGSPQSKPNRTTRKTTDNKLRQTIKALAAFPLATKTQAQLEENQPSREAESVINATPEHTPFVELRQFAVRKILARNPQIAC